MSFRQNGRYGYVPPAQYGNPQNIGLGVQRRDSYASGDDASLLDNTTRGQQLPPHDSGLNQQPTAPSSDELYIGGGAPSQSPIRYSHNTANPLMAGYQSQYQPPLSSSQQPSSYNPQHFARTHSQNQSGTSFSPQIYNVPQPYSNPQPYNPAAYSPQPQLQPQLQRQATHSSFGTASPYTPSPPLVGQGGSYWSHSESSTAAPSSRPQPSCPYVTTTHQVPFVPSTSTPAVSRVPTYGSANHSVSYTTNGSNYVANNHGMPYPLQPTQSFQPLTSSAPQYGSPLQHSTSYSNNIRPLERNDSPYSSTLADSTGNTGLQRHPTHRPLPSAPIESEADTYRIDVNGADRGEEAAQEQIYQEIVAAINNSASHHNSNGDLLDSELSDLQRFDSRATTLDHRLGRNSSSASTLNVPQMVHDEYSEAEEDSDAEAAAGLEAMRLAEEQENQRGPGSFGIYNSSQDTARPTQHEAGQDVSSDSDYANIDMGLYGGGYDGQLSYGDDIATFAGHSSEMEDQTRPLPLPHELRRMDTHDNASGLGGMTDYGLPGASALHPFPAFDAARVDTFGTGGLQKPTSHSHRLSFDEGDEGLAARYEDSRYSGHSGSESPSLDDMPDMFYHPGMNASPSRPLPAVPSLQDMRVPQLHPATSQRNPPSRYGSTSSTDGTRMYLPEGPDAYGQQDLLNPNAPFVPRSASLTSHSSTPQIIPPVRSRTDAEERQARQRQLRGLPGNAYDSTDVAGAQSSSVALDLPSLPSGRRRKITPESLKSGDFKRCDEPWALSGISEWIREICGGETGEGEADLREKTITDFLVALFTNKVPTMNVADAEVLAARLVADMFNAGVLVRDEEWVKFGQGSMSGVLWQLSGFGCYAPKLHNEEIRGRCYAHHCGRTLKKLNLDLEEVEPSKKVQDWNVFFKVTDEQMRATDRKEIQRQHALHEIVMSEDKYMDRLNVLRILYRDQLQSWDPPIIGPAKIAKFIKQVFGNVEAIKIANQENLLAQLKYRQQEQGPFVQGFSDIFREWVRKARQAYLEYAAGYTQAVFMVRQEADRNLLFSQFLDQARDNPLSERLDWNTFLFAPLKRLQQYPLLLKEVLKSSMQETEEKSNLIIAIEEITKVTLECDAQVDEMSKKFALVELDQKIYLRPGMRVDLQLTHLGRELIYRGDLQRAGSSRFTILETHALLFDHYLVLGKTSVKNDNTAGRSRETYDVSKHPIPMQLLVLESTDDEPVVKSSLKGVASAGTTRPVASDSKGRSSMSTDRNGNLEHTSTDSSLRSNATALKTVVSTNLENDTKIMYPFRVKHLGKPEVYVLYAPTEQNRQEWCSKILIAKERHAASLFAQNAEPFRLKVIADSAFAYDAVSLSGKNSGAVNRGTPLDRAIREMEREYGHARPGPVCRATVNCATTFTSAGRSLIAIGTDYGVYTTEASNPRGWTRTINMPRISQISVIEDFSLCLIIAAKALIAYHIDVIVPPAAASGYPAPPLDNSSGRRAPQKLSGNREVAFFATARMKDRTLVFYKKRENLNSVFKVVEPVFQKSSEKRSKFFGRAKPYHTGSNTEFFREFDEFYIPAECFSINLFHTYIAVSTQRGFELLTLDKKVSMSVPDLKQQSIVTIAARLSGQKPLGMFRLSDAEFLLCYEECGVYVSKHGEVSRSVVLEFVGKATSAALFGAYLILFDNEFVEVRNAENGRLRQIIAGKDVRCLDYGVPGASSTTERNLKIAMAHPEINGSQLVLELILNSGQKE